MILFDLTSSEANAPYQSLAISNGDRQFSFLQSVVDAAIASEQRFMSHTVLKALNFHAIACLHTNAGDYRPCEVHVQDGQGNVMLRPPPYFRVSALMDDLVNRVNSHWHITDPLHLAAFVLWRLCAIHPFINGNGRTARAACYFVVCTRLGGWLPGDTILPTLLKADPQYEPALRAADPNGDLTQLHALIQRLLREQLASAGVDMNAFAGILEPQA
ncbi:Fic family protein [Cereibacter sphaeroides]|uniref:Fic family protein n=1 Tax=Cereibacter sphaeroides TaxID=1063 RepID=UPI001F3E26B0|nr:Fic family protein [Cereibacter sphaeroides]MCE6951687.1 Fic family protein [Cereibacter sphaeroides]